MVLIVKTVGGNKVAEHMRERFKTIKSELKPAHQAAAVQLESWVQMNFRANGKNHENSSLHWKPVSRAYAKRKVAKGGSPGNLLRDKGDLVRRFKIRSNSKRGQVLNETPYAHNHEEGKGVPRRKIFPTVDQGRKIVLPAYREFIKNHMK